VEPRWQGPQVERLALQLRDLLRLRGAAQLGDQRIHGYSESVLRIGIHMRLSDLLAGLNCRLIR